ncbi:MAG: hypothetical protein M3418_10710, partial [Gemmatimonadota bacterium]|nr:hypothetical protein [Gemmatimonadota bacterium]
SIRGPEGETVVAETQVPGIPRLVAPSRDTTVARNREIRLVWTHSAGAAGYIYIAPNPNTPSFFSGVINKDTMATVALATSYTGGGQVHLRIAAVDSNYVRYKARQELLDRGSFVSTVQGGWGLFGSVAYSDPRVIRLER